MKEEFIDIMGYIGLYQISNLGRVKALKKVLKNGVGYAVRKEKILISAKKENGYLFVNLTNSSGVKKCHYIHRLVAIHFIGNPENKPDVNHKESDKSDNRFFMLEWCTKSENLFHSFKKGTHKPYNGEISSRSKLTDSKVIEIKTKYREGGTSIRKLANEYGVHHSIIDGIMQGKRWSHVNI